MRQNLKLDTHLDFDDEQDVHVIIEVEVDSEDWELAGVFNADDGMELQLTTDLNTAITNYVNDHLGEAISDAEADYADYRYEQ